MHTTHAPQCCRIGELAPHVHNAGLWPLPPSRSTIQRWRALGYIIYKQGAAGKQWVDIPATLKKLKNPYT